MTVSLGIGLKGEYEADFVQSLILRLDDGTTHSAGSSDEYGTGVIKFQVSDDHYTSSFNVISRFYDHSRGWLYNDLARTIYLGFKPVEDVFA